jgi:hypothetical protein
MIIKHREITKRESVKCQELGQDFVLKAKHQIQVCNFNFFNNDFFFLGWRLTPNPGGIAKSD